MLEHLRAVGAALSLERSSRWRAASITRRCSKKSQRADRPTRSHRPQGGRGGDWPSYRAACQQRAGRSRTLQGRRVRITGSSATSQGGVEPLDAKVESTRSPSSSLSSSTLSQMSLAASAVRCARGPEPRLCRSPPGAVVAPRLRPDPLGGICTPVGAVGCCVFGVLRLAASPPCPAPLHPASSSPARGVDPAGSARFRRWSRAQSRRSPRQRGRPGLSLLRARAMHTRVGREACDGMQAHREVHAFAL